MDAENGSTNDSFVSMVSLLAERHGCKIIDIDFDNRVLNLDGPDDAVAACAQALAEMLD